MKFIVIAIANGVRPGLGYLADYIETLSQSQLCDLIGAFEVVAVLRFGQPALLDLALALKLARRLGTEELMTKIASIGKDTLLQ